MDKLDRLLIKVQKLDIVQPYVDYDFSRMPTELLKELIKSDISEERMLEILEPYKFLSRDPNSIRKKFKRMPDEELKELAGRYERINEER